MESQAHPSPDPIDNRLHAHETVLLAVASLAELRESDSGSHLLRLRAYVELLVQALRDKPELAPLLSEPVLEMLRAVVPMYDLGNVGIPDRILLKPGRLTAEEVAIMRTHTTLGYAALQSAEATLRRSSPLLDLAKEVTLSHHERWDGAGYPQGLAGTAIPLCARIVALADVYDALISNKVYKQGVPHEEAVQLILAQRGAHFDPDVVDAFMAVEAGFREAAARHADTDADMQKKIEYLANAIAETASL
jgi:putative two-component system response regulator